MRRSVQWAARQSRYKVASPLQRRAIASSTCYGRPHGIRTSCNRKYESEPACLEVLDTMSRSGWRRSRLPARSCQLLSLLRGFLHRLRGKVSRHSKWILCLSSRANSCPPKWEEPEAFVWHGQQPNHLARHLPSGRGRHQDLASRAGIPHHRLLGSNVLGYFEKFMTTRKILSSPCSDNLPCYWRSPNWRFARAQSGHQ